MTINENADPDVRTDFESIFNDLVPENLPYLVHTIEGPDDMPAKYKDVQNKKNYRKDQNDFVKHVSKYKSQKPFSF